MEIVITDDSSPHLKTIKDIWYPNRHTLGFFPNGAFLDYSRRKQILVAQNPLKQAVGYLIYRISNMRAIIVHLCVDTSCRGQGIAKLLVNRLCDITKKYIGIGLSCRRDFKANDIWPQVGFIANNDRRGRSYDGKPLTFWWMDHGHPSLFSSDQEELLQSHIIAVMDANVFFDLFAAEDADSEESKSLLADWLPKTLKLCLTQEIYNEINRSRDSEVIAEKRKLTNLFTVLECLPEEHRKMSASLRPLFPQKMTKKSDQSDLRQLSRALCCKAHFFITRDAKLLELADDIYEKYGSTILRPSDLIIHVDELINGARYQPARLAGSMIKIELIKSGQVKDLLSFQNFPLHESKADFQRKMRTFLASPTIYEVKIVTDAEQKSLALIVHRRENNLLDIPICRVVKGPLAPTIAKHLILSSVLSSSRDGLTLTKISDVFLSEEITSALTECNFKKSGAEWFKFNINRIDNAATIADFLQQLSNEFPDQSEYLSLLVPELTEASKLKDVYRLYEIERVLWPVKIADSGIPTFIVPIMPKWASELFDEHLANQSLYGCNPELALNRENVFYRSKRTRVSPVGRILWYVTYEKHYTGVMSIRACSYIDSVFVDKPKELYRLFRRLGVYEWKDVYQKAEQNCDNKIMAIRFSDTELFDAPMSWKQLQRLLQRTAPIQSPVEISDNIFAEIYQFGFNKGGN